MAVGYSGDILQARDRAAEAGNDVNDRLLHPEGGRADVARQHSPFPPTRRIPTKRTPSSTSCCKPEIAARNSNFVFYANGNQASQAVARRGGDRATPAIYPDEATLAKLYTTTPSDPRDAARDDAHLDGGEDGPVGS